MSWLSIIALLAAVAGSAHSVPTPVFPTPYRVEGTIELPYAEIVEPYTAWIDPANSRSRIDSYEGLATVLYLGNSGKYGRMKEIVYSTTEKFINRRICLETDGDASASVGMQPVVPDLSKFTYVTEEACSPKSVYQCTVWEHTETLGDKINRYTFRAVSLSGLQFPFDFHFLGYDNLFGSHYDEYRVTYTLFVKYRSGSIPDGVFETNVTCESVAVANEESHSRRRGTFEHLSLFRSADHIDDAFRAFQTKHGKRYSSKSEEFHRRRTFRANHHFVDSMNRLNLTYALRLNHMADLSVMERRNMLGLRRTDESANPPGAKLFVPTRSVSDIPSDFDWRLAGAVTPVKDQAICGSCWSFSTTGVIEGANFLKTKQLVELSQQNLMDCSWGEGNYACDGGEQYRAYKWIIQHGGIATAHSYGPYLMQDGKCHFKNATIGANITGFVRVKTYSEADLLVALAQHPVAVNIDASHNSFSFYAHGVYYEPKCAYKPDDLDHSVLAVGYGTLDGEDYWLVKNSWSVHWGNDGYVLMSRRSNNCGVASDASFVEMA